MASDASPIQRALTSLKAIAAHDYFKSDGFKRLLSAIRFLLLVAVFSYLIWKLTDIGWGAVAAALPTAPLFYVFFAIRYCVLPATELVIYQRLWSLDLRAHWTVFFRKRVLNFGVLDYSGEAYFLGWARNRLNLTDKQVFGAIRDSNILSAVSSNVVTITFLGIFVSQGMAQTLSTNTPNAWIYLAAAAFIAIFLTAAIITFRRQLIGVSRETATWLLGVHTGRMLVIMLLMGAQWASALPDIPWSVWWLFLTANLVLNRLPMLPNKDLVFLGLSVGLAEYVDGPEAALAAVFLASSALTQLTHLAVFTATSFTRDRESASGDAENS